MTTALACIVRREDNAAPLTYAIADPDHRFAFALVKTRMRDAAPGEGAAYLVVRETRAALGIPC